MSLSCPIPDHSEGCGADARAVSPNGLGFHLWVYSLFGGFNPLASDPSRLAGVSPGHDPAWRCLGEGAALARMVG